MTERHLGAEEQVGKQEWARGQEVTGKGGAGPTVDRPRCDCTTGPTEILTATGAPEETQTHRFRYVVRVSSSVKCDRSTPNQCEYHYTAETEVQQQALRPPRPPRPGPWTPFAGRRVFIQSFKVHDDVNQEIKHDRIDQTSAEIVLWRAKAPKKEKTKVTIVLAPSVRGGTAITLEEEIELCLPKLDNPQCP